MCHPPWIKGLHLQSICLYKNNGETYYFFLAKKRTFVYNMWALR